MKNRLIDIRNLVKHFDISGGLLEQMALRNGRIVRERTVVKAVNDVSLLLSR